MDRIKKILNSFVFSFFAISTLICGLVLCTNSKQFDKYNECTTSAEEDYNQISNSLPEYFNPIVSAGEVGNDGNSLFLLSNNGKISISMTNGIVESPDEYSRPNGDSYHKQNYAYMPNPENPDEYYYFNIDSTLSLFYNLTNKDVDTINPTDPRNLLRGRLPENFAQSHDDAFSINQYAFTPKNFNIAFSLKNADDIGFGSGENKHEVILNKEGCYTLVVPYHYYHTQDGGKSFSDENTANIKFSFMVFNSLTYLDANNLPNITVSQFAKSSTLINNQSHSKFYFYNFSSNVLKDQKAQLPTYSFDPHHYQLTIGYNNIEDEPSYYKFKLAYDNGGKEYLGIFKLSQDDQGNLIVDENGKNIETQVTQENCEILARLENNMAELSFNELGSYDIRFDFIYQPQGSEKIFNLPFTAKRQRFYIYGYQATYTSQEKDPITNQTISKELKQVNADSTFEKSADVTSLLASANQTPTNNPPVASTLLEDAKAKLQTLTPISTNQTPIKLNKNPNVTLYSDSKIFNATLDENGNIQLSNEKNYAGGNIQSAGTYILVTIYRFSDYLNSYGVQQKDYFHYQIFYFTITDTTPTVDVVSTAGTRLYDGDYTNKSVVIVDKSTESDYDANVEIKLSATNYVNNRPFFNPANSDHFVNIKDFANNAYPGISYYQDLGELGEYYSQYSGKAGVYIDATNDIASPYHNALFTISIKSATAINPSLRTFTIDTNPIGQIYATTTSYRTSSDYNIIQRLNENQKTSNQPLVFSWNEKASKAQTYGYFKYYELKQNQYYNTGDSAANNNDNLLKSIFENHGIIPVNYTLDLSVSDPSWTNYANTIDYTYSKRIPSAFVRTSAGLYIFEVYDMAGNSSFDVFLIDNTSPMFVQRVTTSDRNYTLSVLSNYTTLTVADDRTINIEWGIERKLNAESPIEFISKKGIYIKGVGAPDYNLPNHLFTKYENDLVDDESKLKDVVENFFQNNSTLITDIPSIAHPEDTESYKASYNGKYLTTDIIRPSYLKEVVGGYKAYDKNIYQINFFKENGEANEGDYKFLLRDTSNTKGEHNEDTFKSDPSAFLTVNISSDSSRLEFLVNVNLKEQKISSSGYDQTGKFYIDGDELVKNDTGSLEKSNLSYKYAHYNPVKTSNQIYLSYIPYASNGSLIQSLTFDYYEFEKQSKIIEMQDHEGKTFTATTWHYTLKNTPASNNPYVIFDLTEQNIGNIIQDNGQGNTAVKYPLSFGGSSESTPAGKYVITRRYKSDGSIDKYDYFERTLTLIVDRYGVISASESVSKEVNGKPINSLESIVGGDILVSMYSGEGQSSISLSFPNYGLDKNDDRYGLNQGSFYTETSFGEDDMPFAYLESNKIPLSVKIPEYKYTLYNEYDYASNDYSVTNNDTNSYFGGFALITDQESEQTVYKVYTELVYNKDGEINQDKSLLLQTFYNLTQANNFIASCKAKASIAEYKLYATIEHRVGDQTVAWYRTDGSSTNGYLNFYKTTKPTGEFDTTNVAEHLTEAGTYIVTVHQANNQAVERDENGNVLETVFKSFYKFAFEIKSSSPDFKVLGEGDIELNSLTENNEVRYYTNTPYVTLSWTDSDSPYMAKIDQTKITAQPITLNFVGRPLPIDSAKIENPSENVYTYKINLGSGENGYNIWENDNKLVISMQYQGFADNTAVKKTIYIDYTAPYKNFATLQEKTANSTRYSEAGSYLSRLFQERNMRDLRSINGQILTSSWNDATLIDEYMKNVSYSYTGTGTFKNFTYQVDKSYFNKIYQSLIDKDILNAKETTELLIRPINTKTDGNDLFADYIQTTKGFSKYSGAYNNLIDNYDNLDNILKSGYYYEIVELDTAGNMVVYLVYYSNDITEDTAIEYTNKKRQDSEIESDQKVILSNGEMQEGFNIYSTSGFKLLEMNYNNDIWGFYRTYVNRTQNLYLKSPRLSSGKIYRIRFTGNYGYQVNELNISELFDDVNPSSTKHNITLSDRLTGETKTLYLSIQDGNLTTTKYSNSTSATLSIDVSSFENIQSPTRVEIFPVEISISYWNTYTNQWDNSLLNSAKVANGDPNAWKNFNSSVVTFDYSLARLNITLNLQENTSQKFRYVITDNFGNETTVIQLANEKEVQEIVGSNIYTNVESDTSVTYLSSNAITYQYNRLLYSAEVIKVYENQVDVTKTNPAIQTPRQDNVMAITLSAGNGNYDKVYVIEVRELETGDFIKRLNLRVYNKLPMLSISGNINGQNSVWFTNKNGDVIDGDKIDNIENIPNLTIKFNNKTITTNAKAITTFSNNVTVHFNDGQVSDEWNEEQPSYFKPYSFSVYISQDGETWTNVNDSILLGYTLSGTGSYYVLVKYDEENLFNDLNQLFMVNILNSSSVSYYFHVDGMPVNPRHGFSYTAPDTGDVITTVYMLNVNPIDKEARVSIEGNEELHTVGLDKPRQVNDKQAARAGVEVWEYTYSSDKTNRARFVVIYIGEKTSILNTLYYEDITMGGSNKDWLQIANPANPDPVVASDSSFKELKLTWNSTFAIAENNVNVKVLKYFNGDWKEVNVKVQNDSNNLSHISLTRAGSYRIYFEDSCANPNKHMFGRSEFINVVFLNGVPYTLTYTDPVTQEEVTSEPINRAIYNGTVRLSLSNPSSYFTSGYEIEVLKDGKPYSVQKEGVNNFIFSENGFYSVTFKNVVSINQQSVREDTITFSIINSNESRFAFEFGTYSDYYISSIIKNGVDVTQRYVDIIDTDKKVVDGQEFLRNLQISYFDMKTGSGRYVVTIETGEQTYKNTTATSFSFAFRINMAYPPITVALDEGGTTSSPINVSFNMRNLYESVGDCIVKIPGKADMLINAETVGEQEVFSTDITAIGTDYVQVYTMSGNLLYSYKITRTEPLNVWAIIAIVISVIVVGVVIFITVKLRKRLKVK